MTTADLCRDVAMEAVRRGARANVHELWALLEDLDAESPSLIVDIGSGPAVWWAWWSLCPNVIGVSATAEQAQPAFSGSGLPSSVVALVGDPREASTALRVADQIARRPVDALVISGAVDGDAARWMFHTYAPHVREGGQVLVHGIANPATPGVGAFWRALDGETRELIGAQNPDGYGIVTVPRKVSHG